MSQLSPESDRGKEMGMWFEGTCTLRQPLKRQMSPQFGQYSSVGRLIVQVPCLGCFVPGKPREVKGKKPPVRTLRGSVVKSESDLLVGHETRCSEV